jgi:hypothetical protein
VKFLTTTEPQVRSPGEWKRVIGRRGLVVVLVIAFVIFGVTIEFTLLPGASKSATVATPSESVSVAADAWVSALTARNVTALSDFYGQNVTVDWSGDAAAAGLTGIYHGRTNVLVLYGSTIGKMTSLNVTIGDYIEKVISPFNDNITFTLNMTTVNSKSGKTSMSVGVSEEWNYSVTGAAATTTRKGQQEGQWQIVKENWDYTMFEQQYVCCAITFPQWMTIKDGLTPDLVPEKSFEWQAGPYVAASVYASLGAVAMTGLLMVCRSQRLGITGCCHRPALPLGWMGKVILAALKPGHIIENHSCKPLKRSGFHTSREA